MNFVLSDAADPEAEKAIRDPLVAYNLARFGESDKRDIIITIRNDDNEVTGGLVGHTARADDLDLTGLDTPIEDVKEALKAPAEKWQGDLADNEEWLKSLGDRMPQEMWDELDALKARIKERETKK